MVSLTLPLPGSSSHLHVPPARLHSPVVKRLIPEPATEVRTRQWLFCMCTCEAAKTSAS